MAEFHGGGSHAIYCDPLPAEIPLWEGGSVWKGVWVCVWGGGGVVCETLACGLH